MAVAHLLLSATLTSAATLPVPVSVTGWTPAAWMGFIQNILLAGLGGGGLKILANHFLSLRQIAAQRVKDVDSRADGITDRLTERVTELEKALSDERRECDKQLAEMRGEIKAMQERVDGLVRQLIAAQVAAAGAAASGVNAPIATARAAGMTADIGRLLQQTYDIPAQDGK